MAKHRGKKYLEVAKLVEIGKLYDIREALELVQKTKTAKFVETVEVALRLGVDPRHADQQIRGTVVLPHGTGKTVKRPPYPVVFFCHHGVLSGHRRRKPGLGIIDT